MPFLSFVFVCVCVHKCVGVYVCMHVLNRCVDVCAFMCAGQRTTLGVIPQAPPTFYLSEGPHCPGPLSGRLG